MHRETDQYLDTAVGEQHSVAAIGGVSVTGLVGVEVNVGVVVLDGVLVFVVHGPVIRGLRLVRGGGGVGGGGRRPVGCWRRRRRRRGVVGEGHSGQGKDNEGLQHS